MRCLQGIKICGLRVGLWAAIITNTIDGMGTMFVEPILPYYLVAAMTPWQKANQALIVSLISASYALSQTGFGLALGTLSDKIGRKPVLIGGLIGATCMYAVQGLVGSVWAMFAVRFVLGAVCATGAVSEGYVLDQTDSDQERTSAMSYDMALGSVASALGAVIGSTLYTSLGGASTASFEDNERAWRDVCFIMAGVCFVEVCVGTIFFESGKHGKVADASNEVKQPTEEDKPGMIPGVDYENPFEDPIIKTALYATLFGGLASILPLSCFVFLLKNQYGFTAANQGQWQCAFGIANFLTTFIAKPQINTFGKEFCMLANVFLFPVLLIILVAGGFVYQDTGASMLEFVPYAAVLLVLFGPASAIAENLLFANLISPDRQGEVFGVFGAIGGGVAVVAVPLSGFCYDVWWALPFIIGITLMIVNIPITIRLIKSAAEREKKRKIAKFERRLEKVKKQLLNSTATRIVDVARCVGTHKPHGMPGGCRIHTLHHAGTLRGDALRDMGASDAINRSMTDSSLPTLSEKLLRSQTSA